MAKIFEYVYDQQTSKYSYLNWLELVDQLVEGEELQQVVSHFQRYYELSRFGVSQHIKRWLCNCYDFEKVKFLRNLEPHHLGISQARYLLILEYVLFFSGENKNKSQQFRLIIDGVESFSELEKAFSKVISIADVEIPLIFPRSPGPKEGKRAPHVYHYPSYRGYQRQLVKHAKMVEKRFGFNLYKEVSRSLGIDVFQIAISVINQYLYWHNVFSTVVGETCLTWRDYSNCSIKREVLQQLGGANVCTVQRAAHWYRPLAAFVDFDIYFPLGEWFSENCRKQKGRIGKSYPIGSLICENSLTKLRFQPMKYDLLYIDQGFVEGKDNWENCRLLYDWILNIKRANPSFRVAIKPPSNAGTARRARLFPEQIGRSYEELDIEILSGDAYEHALSAKVIAAHYSTMVYELKGSGLPVLICDPLGECKFFPDSERFNQFVVTNYDSFFDLISEILLNKGSLAELIGTKEFQYFGHNSYGAAEKMVEILLN